MRFRNHLYNQGLKPSVGFDLPVISVGNLTVGGTGKTPHIEYLIRLLKGKYKVATLSRGYGRKTKGFLLAEEAPNAKSIGDEPMQFHQKYGNEVVVAVGEQRVFAIPEILRSYDDRNIILLDDAYQHRKVKPSLSILLTDYNRLFYQDFLLPAGRLRESRSGAKRAHIIIVSKCPDDLNKEEQKLIEKKIRKYCAVGCPVFFTGIRYGKPLSLIDQQEASFDKVLLLTGIAKATPLKDYVAKNFELMDHIKLGDHIDYTPELANKVKERFTKLSDPHTAIITTEKDAVKLVATELSRLHSLPIFYIPIEVYFLNNEGEVFDRLIAKHLEEEWQI